MKIQHVIDNQAQLRRFARVMLNAELVHGKRSRIIIPTVYREDYLLALRALTRQGNTDPYIKDARPGAGLHRADRLQRL